MHAKKTGRRRAIMSEHFIIAPDDRILVTGAAGFIGSRVVESLVDRGFRNLVCFARPSSELAGIEAIFKRRPQGHELRCLKAIFSPAWIARLHARM